MFIYLQHQEVDDIMNQQAQILKEEVKMMFQSSNPNIMQKLNFIDSIQRFGISYHFQKEINQALEQIHNTLTKDNTIISEDGNHHFLALLFQLLRQQGYQISSNVFNKFKNEQGNFNETLANNIQGLCSLYEAAHLRIDGDDVLEEAYDFSNTQLMSLANQLSPSLAAQINHYLRQPLNKSVLRFEARWWKQSNVMKKVPHARDRLVECYLWILAMSYKPEDSNGRMFAGKLSTVITLLDDAYDAYGTVEELELLTEAFKRWDIGLIGSLPLSMKVIFDTIVELSKEMELLTAHTGKSSLAVQHFKQAICNLAKAYMVEAKWCHKGYIPTYDEYKANGILTSCCPLLFTSMICLGEFATKDVLDWIFSDPKILQASSIIGRVMDDMASHKFEQQRVHVASSVECCMNQYGISEIEAYKLIRKDIEDYWKVINEEYLNSYNIPKSVLDCVANFARMSEFSYENRQDKFTNGELLKDDVSSLLLNPICLEECK
uniref:(+)-delta-cadinene synthase isozyme C2 n=1 Tax=Cajanus cajan TaxID=3821 RepID=A0A151R010_CAJCA|nr:(+)-delta-cadinene synthase isozyme C2 [Cajanus cajan]